jgi:CPA2 family monovalent cation:H+ antiporter-2
VIRVVQEQRDARYSLLKGYFHGADDDSVDEIDHERLHTVTLPAASRWVGRPLGQLALSGLGARLVSLRRAGGKASAFDDDTPMEGGDTLVLGGKAQALLRAEDRLLSG